MRDDEKREGCFCLKHTDIAATGKFVVRFGRSITKAFKEYQPAKQFLWGLRFKTVENTLDTRDYKRDNPLGFKTQSEKFLAIKKKTVSASQYRNIRRDINKAVKVWGPLNVKSIGKAEIEDFLYELDCSEKTRANTRSVLNTFWTWLVSREEGIKMPEIPKIKFELGWRNVIDLEDQAAILDEIRRISWSHNPRIWIGIKWLATYIAIRPNEMRNIKEREIDINGYLVIPHPKEKKPKLVPMTDEDIELYHSLPRGMPDMWFFRHGKLKGRQAGEIFGKDYFYHWWRRACNNLGIKGVDLYGGTRHSTTTALSAVFGRQRLQDDGTYHKSKKAFDRYCQGQRQASVDIYEKAAELRGGGKVIPLSKPNTQ
jgi:integrase